MGKPNTVIPPHIKITRLPPGPSYDMGPTLEELQQMKEDRLSRMSEEELEAEAEADAREMMGEREVG